ncbi:energy-coupling factor ABC transporter ATP-binding protein [Candidatus Formimonas warabiya]|uniref:ABC transporter ATP-binding protein n=1 Tax=Formimonas warabiya TaxID=1761012 RepID=A0A3G1KZA2_FORW1|nr:ATP-binding cassette domain-containing protein [Candidatus Formimonas warabiya]ATW27555.1 energy-coupling factor ABC transporter ATP-binding protein [Candidatus Formimonas warabiya]
MPEYILEAENLEFSYMDGTTAIRNLSLKLEKGKKYAVVGNNGAGKSTLFLHFNGVHRPAKGNIKYKGEVVNYSHKRLKELRKNVGVVFQDPDNQLFSASVYQDISFGPVNLGWPEEKIRAKVEQALKRTGTWDFKDKPTHFLSHGQKKRVAIAGILAMEPEVIFLDEPTAGLDPFYCTEMMQLLDDFNQMGATLILSSHDLNEVYAWADYIFVMNSGEIIAEGLPEEIFRNAQVLKTANLGKPWVLEVFDELVKNKALKEQTSVPRKKDQLLDLFSQFQVI